MTSIDLSTEALKKRREIAEKTPGNTDEILAMIDEIERLRIENQWHKEHLNSNDIFLNAVIHHSKKNWDIALTKRIEELTEDNKRLDEAYNKIRDILNKNNLKLMTKVKELRAQNQWLARMQNDNVPKDEPRCPPGCRWPVCSKSCAECWQDAAKDATNNKL